MSLELKEGYNGITDPEELKKKEIKDEVEDYVNKLSDESKSTIIHNIAMMNRVSIRLVFEDVEDIPESYCGNYTPVNVLIRSTPTIKVRYHKENCPELIEMEKNPIGDFIDLRAAENVELSRGEFKLISLGISVQLPKGYHAEVVPRSSTYKNFGIIMSNSIGIIDESYCGDNDIWMMPVIAMRDTKININDRICQFRIVRNRDINIEVVDKLDNEDRGGIGSTGKN